MSEETIRSIFHTLRLMVFESGGDGDSWLVSSKYRELADKFQEYEKSLIVPWFTNRTEYNEIISFGNWHEAVYFVGERQKIGDSIGDGVIEVL